MNPVNYTGGTRDTTTGLTKLGTRYYNSALGRFTQPDPSGQEVNAYAYAAEDPIDNADPSGQLFGISCSFCRKAVAYIAAGAVIAGVNGLLDGEVSPVVGGAIAGCAGGITKQLIIGGLKVDNILPTFENCLLGSIGFASGKFFKEYGGDIVFIIRRIIGR